MKCVLHRHGFKYSRHSEFEGRSEVLLHGGMGERGEQEAAGKRHFVKCLLREQRARIPRGSS